MRRCILCLLAALVVMGLPLVGIGHVYAMTATAAEGASAGAGVSAPADADPREAANEGDGEGEGENESDGDVDPLMTLPDAAWPTRTVARVACSRTTSAAPPAVYLEDEEPPIER